MGGKLYSNRRMKRGRKRIYINFEKIYSLEGNIYLKIKKYYKISTIEYYKLFIKIVSFAC